MTKSTITREQLEEWVAQFEEDGGCDATDRQLEALIRQSLAAMNNEPVAFTEKHEISNMHATGLYLRAWPADRARNSVEGYTIPLYTTPQPISLVNSEPVAYIFKHPAGRLFWALTDESNKGHDDVMPVYAAPQPAPVVPEEKPIPNTLSMYAVDAVAAIAEVKGWNACRAAMLQAGNSPVIPGAQQRIADAVELLQKAAPAMLADNSGPDGPLAGRLKSPVIPDGSAYMLRRWLAFGRGMQNAGSQLPHNLIAETESMLAAAPTGIPMIPDGYVMVPKVATEKMLIAGLEEANPLGGLIDWDASRGDCNTREQVQEIFKAMLAAAPQEVKGE